VWGHEHSSVQGERAGGFVRSTKSTTFIVLQDVSGTVQTVGPPKMTTNVKRDDAPGDHRPRSPGSTGSAWPRGGHPIDPWL
jgi:hypothetical protein